MASATERFLAEKFAPALLSRSGKSSVLFIYCVLILISIYGVSQIKIAFGVEFFINEDSKIYEYFQAEKEYFRTGFKPVTLWDSPAEARIQIEKNTFGDEETQLRLIEFNDRLARCRDCSVDWHLPGSLDSWYIELQKWVDKGLCDKVPDGLDPFDKIIPEEEFRACLNQFLDTNMGKPYNEDLKFSNTWN